jgi:protein gp37
MGEKTGIGWTNHTFNLWWGCTQVCGDPACDECYAMTRAENPYWWGKETAFPVWGADAGRRFFGEDHYREPFAWNRRAEKRGTPARVFCMSMGDWAEGRPDQRPYLERHLFPTIEATPWLTWLLLTKHPTQAAAIAPESWRRTGWPRNAWPGVTTANQRWWDIRVPQLLAIPAARRFVSCEPLVDAIEMGLAGRRVPRPDWVIAGGMSGSLRRVIPMHPAHARGLRDQCVAAGVPFFFKQWGAWRPVSRTDGVHELPFGNYLPAARFGYLPNHDDVADKLLDGRRWEQFPEAA